MRIGIAFAVMAFLLILWTKIRARNGELEPSSIATAFAGLLGLGMMTKDLVFPTVLDFQLVLQSFGLILAMLAIILPAFRYSGKPKTLLDQ